MWKFPNSTPKNRCNNYHSIPHPDYQRRKGDGMKFRVAVMDDADHVVQTQTKVDRRLSVN